MSASLATLAAAIIRKQARKLAAKFANQDMPDIGLWLGKYTKTKIDEAELRYLGVPVNSTNIYRIDLDRADPLRFVHADSGIQYRPEMNFACDLGSIPWFLQSVKKVSSMSLRLQPDQFPKSYILHDSACLKASVSVRHRDGDEWTRIPLKRVEADVLLYWGLSAEGCRGHEATRLECQAIYRAARSPAGAYAWRKRRLREREHIARL